ncbi:hypothetical protein ACIHFD_66325 [Nonomuraea sp. NPDC051941]|uniref:hypothetical protein n=1 Tax=Nonomuraea sp. NPDC051941 TaxID=3364373 RepID=UPI0037CC0D15
MVRPVHCTDAEIWQNPNSVYAPVNNVLTRSVSIGTGGFAYTTGASGLNVKTFNPGFDSFNAKGTTPPCSASTRPRERSTPAPLR